MTPTKSSHPKQIEEESDARAPNLSIGPDHEDDTSNQGSDDAGAPNLPIGPDHEDEDGSHSPIDYLNLNQYDIPQVDNEEDATNAEHESDENEDEGNAKQALVGTLSASQVRHGCGPNKLPSECFVITEVIEVVDPTQPSISVNA
jgi:hypothetical protein